MSRAPLAGLALAAALAAPCGAAAQDLLPPPLGTAPAVAPSWRFLPSATLAYDSFGQRYVLAEEDTFDLVDEMSARVAATLEHHGATELHLRNTFGYGQEATRNDLQLRLRRRFGPVELRLDDELQYKAYTRGTSLVLSSDYLQDNLRATGIFKLSQSWQLRLEDRFEWADFEKRTTYSYDYLLNDAGAEIERTYSLFSTVRAGYSWGMRSVPDSSAIDYRRHLVTSNWQHDFGPHGLTFDQRIERRLYEDPRARSHFADWDAGMEMRWALRSELRLRPEYRIALTRFDTPDSVYADATEHSVQLVVEGDVGERTTVGLGPRGEFRRTEGGIERAYDQWGLKGSVQFTAGTRFWIQFTDEVGTREHLAGDDTFFSDYLFNWSTLYLSYEPVPRLTFDLFFSLNPESHADNANDTATILVSTSLTYGLR